MPKNGTEATDNAKRFDSLTAVVGHLLQAGRLTSRMGSMLKSLCYMGAEGQVAAYLRQRFVLRAVNVRQEPALAGDSIWSADKSYYEIED